MGVFSRLRDALARRRALSRNEVFDLARQDKFTGAVTFHFRDGKPLTVATGAPLQAELIEEEYSIPDGVMPMDLTRPHN